MCKTNLNLLPLNSGCFCSTSLSLSAGFFLCSLFECQMLKYLLNKFWLWFGKINVLQRVEGGEKGCPLLNFCMFWEITGPRCLMKKSWELPNVLRATGFTVHGSAGVYVNFQSSRCLNPAARNLKEIRVVRGSLSALAVIPYLFVVDPSEGGSGILFVQTCWGKGTKSVMGGLVGADPPLWCCCWSPWCCCGFLSLASPGAGAAELLFPTSLHRSHVSSGPAHRPAALLRDSFKILHWHHVEK